VEFRLFMAEVEEVEEPHIFSYGVGGNGGGGHGAAGSEEASAGADNNGGGGGGAGAAQAGVLAVQVWLLLDTIQSLPRFFRLLHLSRLPPLSGSTVVTNNDNSVTIDTSAGTSDSKFSTRNNGNTTLTTASTDAGGGMVVVSGATLPTGLNKTVYVPKQLSSDYVCVNDSKELHQ